MERQKIFWALFLANFAIALGFGLVDTFFSVYLLSLGAKGAFFAFSVTAYSISKTICGPLIGTRLDRCGQKHCLLLSLSLYLFVSCCYLFVNSLWILVALRFLQGVACAMFRPVVLAIIQQSASENRKSTVLGTFDISFYCAVGLGPMISGVIKHAWGFQGIFIVLWIFCLLAVFCSLYAVLNEQHRRDDYSVRHLQSDRQLRSLLMKGSFPGLLLYIFGRACSISILIVFLPILLTHQMSLDDTHIGLVMGASTVALIILLRPSGKLADRTSPKILVTLGGISSSLLFFAVPLTANFNQILLLTVIMGVCSSVSQPAASAMLVLEGKQAGIGITAGIFNSVLNLGIISGPLVGTVILKFFEIDTVFYTAGAIGIMSVMAFFYITPVRASNAGPIFQN
jgi:MFS family permease